jgi:hypothetical protein
MFNYWKWLLAVSVVSLMAPMPLMAADSASKLTGFIEAGGDTVDIKDDKTRVNEYSTTIPDDGTRAYGKIKLNGQEGSTFIDLDGEFYDSDSLNYDFELDASRRVKFNSSYDRFTHWLEHDQLNYINAGIPSGGNAAKTLTGLGYPKTGAQDSSGGTIGAFWEVPNYDWLDANNVPGYIGKGQDGTLYAFNPASPYYKTSQIANAPQPIAWQQIGRASVLGEDFVPNQNFYIVYKEFKNEADLEIIPNVTLHFGQRLERRKGYDQTIGMSKCTSCHITGDSKKIDEETKDLRFGATGKFGLLTVEYNYLDREFNNDASDPTRYYDPALSPNPNTQYTTGNATFDNRLLYDYEAGALPYDTTPDSKKQSHAVKARVDLPQDMTMTGSYVYAKSKSNKDDAVGLTINQNKITSTYDGYGLKITTKPLDRLSINLRVKGENVKSNNFTYDMVPVNTTSSASLGGAPEASYYSDIEREAANDGDTLTLGVDGLYRLGRKTTLRAGYEYEDFDRDLEDLGHTKTHTLKASIKSRFGKNVSARASYKYQDIDEPLHNPDAAMYIDPNTGLPYYDKDQQLGDGTIIDGWTPGFQIGTGPTYGTDYYDLRQADLTNLPETVNEIKASTTWSPTSGFSATLAFLGRFEENDLSNSKWQEDTYSPTVSFWYSPSEKLNLNLLYNYMGQRAESKFCQGWYDG